STNWAWYYYSGQPHGLVCTITTNDGGGCTPTRVPGVDPYLNKRDKDGFLVLFNPAAFTNPPKATAIGQTDLSPLGGDRSPVLGPPQRQLDFSIFKNFRLTERFRMEFRAEIFNLTNTVSYGFPSNYNNNYNNFSSQLFGRLDNQRNDPRQM